MNKRIVILSIISGALFALGILLFAIVPAMLGGAPTAYWDFAEIFGKVFPGLGTLLAFDLSSASIGVYFCYALDLLVIIVFILHVALLISGKRLSSLWVSFAWLVIGMTAAFNIYVLFSETYFDATVTGAYSNTVMGLLARGYNPFQLVMSFLPFILIFAALITMSIAEVFDLVEISKTPENGEEGSHTMVKSAFVKDEPADAPIPNSESIRKILHDEIALQAAASQTQPSAAPAAPSNVAPAKIDSAVAASSSPFPFFQGPILVQYINTYSPNDPNGRAVENVVGGTGEVKSGAAKTISIDDVRRLINDESAMAKKPCEAATEKPLTAAEVRAIFAEELAKVVSGNSNLNKSVSSEPETLKAVGTSMDPAELRSHIAEGANRTNSFASPVSKSPIADKPLLTSEQVRTLVNAELAMAGDSGRTEAEKDVNEPKPVSRPIVNLTRIGEEAAAKADAEENGTLPKITAEPIQAPTVQAKPVVSRLVGVVNPNLPPHSKIIRIPFPKRMLSAEKDMQSNYNDLKSEALSYGVNSRISNSGDTFRLHRQTFLKITIAGKALKLYFALDPKDYANSTLPIQDAGNKGIYKEIPLVFKVKSDLSLRRAKQLIADAMEKGALERGNYQPNNWAADVANHLDGLDSDKDDEK